MFLFGVVVLFGINLKTVLDLGCGWQIAVVFRALEVGNRLAGLDFIVSCEQAHKKSRAARPVGDAVEKLTTDAIVAIYHPEKIAFSVKRYWLERIKRSLFPRRLERQSFKKIPDRPPLYRHHRRRKTRHETVEFLLKNLAVSPLFHHRRKTEQRAVFV